MFYYIITFLLVLFLPLFLYFRRRTTKPNRRNEIILHNIRSHPKFNLEEIYDTSILEEKSNTTIYGLYIIPVKGGQCIGFDEWNIESSGMFMDRTWAIIERETEKRCSYEKELFTIEQNIGKEKDGSSFITLKAPNMRDFKLKIEDNPSKMKDLQNMSKALRKNAELKTFQKVVGYEEGEEANKWVSTLMKKDVVLFRGLNIVETDEKPGFVPENTYSHDRKNAFHFGCSVHVVNLESLKDLNIRLAKKGERELHLKHFRQNILLANMEPYEEDTLYEFRVKNAIFRFFAPTVRCKIMQFDYQQQQYAKNKEPIPTLNEYRRDPQIGPLFGIYVVVNIIEDKEFLAKLIKDKDALKEALDAVTGTGRTLLKKGDRVYIRKRQKKFNFVSDNDTFEA